jgi:hypothetical protein
MDKTKNRFGNQLLDFDKGNNIFVMNDRLQNDLEGNLTCRNARLVDYCLYNVNFLQNIIDLDVLEFPSLYSDFHSVIVVSLRCMFDENQNDENQIVDNSLNRNNINKWDHDKNSDFQNNLSLNELQKLVNDLETAKINSLAQGKINSFV